MGNCCSSSSNGLELNNSPQFYHVVYPSVSEEHGPLSSLHVAVSAIPTGILVDTNLETSIPDTYRPPPAPLPYDANLGRPRTLVGNQAITGNKNVAVVQPSGTEPVAETNTGIISHELTSKILNKTEEKVQNNVELVSSEEPEDELEKSGELKKSSEPLVSELEEEDVCPTCLDEYDEENPKIITKCEHHFHLSCIFEWLERSDTCPVCDQEMVFDAMPSS